MDTKKEFNKMVMEETMVTRKKVTDAVAKYLATDDSEELRKAIEPLLVYETGFGRFERENLLLMMTEETKKEYLTTVRALLPFDLMLEAFPQN